MNGALLAARHTVTPTHHASGVYKLIQWQLRRHMLTRTTSIRVRRLGILKTTRSGHYHVRGQFKVRHERTGKV